MATHRKKLTFAVWLRMFWGGYQRPTGHVYSYESSMRTQASLEAETILFKVFVSLETSELTTGRRPTGCAVTYGAWSRVPLLIELLRYHLRRTPVWRELNMQFDPSLTGLSVYRFVAK